jgi:hypothetical protein
MPETKSKNPYGPDGVGGCGCLVCFIVAWFGWILVSASSDSHEQQTLLSALGPELPGLAKLYSDTRDEVHEDRIELAGASGPVERFRVEDRVLILQAGDEIREKKRSVSLGSLLQRVPAGNRPTSADFHDRHPITFFILGPAGELLGEHQFRSGRRLLVVSWPKKSVVLNVAFGRTNSESEDAILQWIRTRVPPRPSPVVGLSPATIWVLSSVVVGLVFLVVMFVFANRHERAQRSAPSSDRPRDCTCTALEVRESLNPLSHGILAGGHESTRIAHFKCSACRQREAEFWSDLKRSAQELQAAGFLILAIGLLAFGGLWWHFALGSMSLLATTLLALLAVGLAVGLAGLGLLLLARYS